VDAEVVGQRELDLCQLITGEVVDGVTDDVVHIDRPDPVDQHSRQPTSDFDFGTMDGRTGRGRRRNHADDRQRRVRRGQEQAQSLATLLMAPWATQVDPVDGPSDHQASGSVLTSSSFSPSASARNWANQRS